MTTTNLDVLAYEKSPIGMICLRRRELVASPGTIITEITVDHELLMSSYHTESERALASAAIERHDGEGLRVLVGGLGLGYTVQQALSSSRVSKVDVVEFIPQVIDWMRDGLVPLSEELNADMRCEIILGDIYAMLAEDVTRSSPGVEARERYDLILVDVDHSPDERLGAKDAFFYTEEGLLCAKGHLASQGILGVWSYAEHSPFVESLRKVFSRVDVVPVSFENEIAEEQETNWLFLATDAADAERSQTKGDFL